MKTCKSCDQDKPVSAFHKAGRGTYRGSCKPCVNGNLRDSYEPGDAQRQNHYIEMPDDVRQKTYVDVINRMKTLGIMSDETYLDYMGRAVSDS